ncbi:MAG: hypothetical protein PHD10_04430 [Bacilli bacterium]|mgnify:CR=1 FL=1|nr:hypothetical protein [Bacilli bacterium]MDD4608356.1 hypothetical protein [Bacilli bacterium]
MLEKEFEDNFLEEKKDYDFKCKKDDCCVCINVYTKCDKDHPWKKDEKFYKDGKKEDCCVCINVYTECE